MTIKQAIQKVIDLAVSQIGYTEPHGDNHNKYAAEIDTRWKGWFNGSKDGYDWCSVFVNWLFLTAFGEDVASKILNHSSQYGKMSAVVQYLYRSLMEVNRVGKEPHVGDIIFYHNDKYEGLAQLCHVGIVWKVEGDYITTIEGNSGKNNTEVATRKIKKDYDTKSWGIYGFGYPDYAAAADSPTKYPEPPFEASTVRQIYYRKTPTKNAPDRVGMINKGATLTIEEVDGEFGKVTGYVLLTSNFKYKSMDGYTVGKEYKVTCSSLNIRASASTNAKIVGELKKGAKVTCKALKMDASGNTWMQMADGWIAAHYNGERYVN